MVSFPPGTTPHRAPAVEIRPAVRQVRKLVFVADDLGLTTAANRGIARAAAAGIVSEASLCVNGADAREGVSIARDHAVGIGLHLCLTAGRALSGPIRGLTDARGHFHPMSRGLAASICGAIDRAAVHREIEAQFAQLRELGVQPTHANGHHHVHCWPGVREVSFAVFRAQGIHWTRLPDEVASRKRHQPSRLFLASLARASRRHVTAAGLQTLPFVGGTLQNRADHTKLFLATLRDLPSGPCEWMVHPRAPDSAQTNGPQRASTQDLHARSELDTLTGPQVRETLRELGFEPARFAAL